MKAIYFKAGQADLIETPRPVPVSGQALIKPILAGVCNTDVELLEGYYGFEGVPGHEFVGRVVDAPGRPDLVGLRATGEINIGCGSCPECLGGDARHCFNRKVLGIKDWDGVFAEYFLLPVDNLHPAAEGVSDLEAVFAEPLAAALEISQQIHLTADMTAAVLGDGKLGLLIAMALSVFLPRLVLIGRHQNKLDLAKQAGVNVLLAAGGDEAPIAGDGGRLYDLVIEATGRPEGVNRALELVKPRGTVAVKTTSRYNSDINLAGFVVAEKKLVGSRCGDIGLALRFLEKKIVDPKPLVEGIYALDDFRQALDAARRPGAGKAVIRF